MYIAHIYFDKVCSGEGDIELLSELLTIPNFETEKELQCAFSKTSPFNILECKRINWPKYWVDIS